jgi:hypothetical protein
VRPKSANREFGKSRFATIPSRRAHRVTSKGKMMVEKYHGVNSQWPEGSNQGRNLKPTPQEAMAGARRLYRLVFKKPFKGEIKLTSGRRYTFIRRGVMYRTPEATARNTPLSKGI